MKRVLGTCIGALALFLLSSHLAIASSERYFGVSSAQIQALLSGIQQPGTRNSESCWVHWGTDPRSRGEFVACLAESGSDFFSIRFLQTIFKNRAEIYRQRKTPERQHSQLLLSYLGDLSREYNYRVRRKNMSWVGFDGKFYEASDQDSFDYRDGDVVVSLAKSSISSIITQVTRPVGQFSHSFIVRSRNGKRTSIESHVEKGVAEISREHFAVEEYNRIIVLRWKKGTGIPGRASDFAHAYLGREYDFAMDYQDDRQLSCTETVVHPYVRASGVAQEKLFPSLTWVGSEALSQYLEDFGMRPRETIAPDDFLYSPYFEVVAEYRPQHNMLKAWEMAVWGEYFLDRLSENYKVVGDPLVEGLPRATWLLQLFPSLIHEKARVIPKGISPKLMAGMISNEFFIYRPMLNLTRKKSGFFYLKDTEPSNLYDWYAWAHKKSVRANNYLRGARKKRKRIPYHRRH